MNEGQLHPWWDSLDAQGRATMLNFDSHGEVPPGRSSLPHVDVLAERAVRDDVEGPLPGIVAEVDGAMLRDVSASLSSPVADRRAS